MAGLFDFLSTEDPNQAAYNAMMFGLLGGKGNLNQRLSQGGMNAMEVSQQARTAQARKKQQELQQQMLLMEMAEMQRKREEALALPGRTQEAIASFPQAGVVQGPPTEDGAYAKQEPQAQDYMSWAMKAQALDPKIAQFGLNSADRVIARDERASNAREAQAALFRQQTERDAAKAVDDLQRQREAMQGRAQLAQVMAGLRPAPAEQPLEAIVGPDGKPRLVSRKDAIGQTPFVKASGTLDKKEQQAQDGKESLAGIVDDLRANYDSLEKSGDITSTKNNSFANAAAFAKASLPGQLAGKIVGSSAQSERNKIMQARPALINAIKNATGMSAQQMNSNVELKLMLDSATDPTLDLEANRAALDRIERDYIKGGSKPAKAKESKLSPAEQDELDQLRKRFGK